jgi:alkylation response protein AidB-like acyl-CoA dehydrogenase
VDVRLTSEQRQLREEAAKLADDLGPGSVADLDDDSRVARLDKTIQATGWRSLRSDEATGVEVALVVEEFARGLVDVPFLGPVLVDDLARRLDHEVSVPASRANSIDLTRSLVGVVESPAELAELSEEDASRWYALALTATTADLVGAARGTLALATDYAKMREQYGATIGSYQAVGHLLA